MDGCLDLRVWTGVVILLFSDCCLVHPLFDISNTCGNVSDLFSNLNKHFELDSGVCLHLSNDLFIVTLGCRVMFTTINPNQKAGLDILTVVYILKLNWLKSWVL